MVKLGEKIKYKNLNTGIVREGFVQSELNGIVGIGDHSLSWFKKADIKVLKTMKHRMQRFAKSNKDVL